MEYRLLLFLATCQTLNVYGTLKISYLSYIATIHKAKIAGFIWQKVVKQNVKAPGPLVLNIGLYGRENFKMLLFFQMAYELFQTFPEFSSQWSSQKYSVGISKFRFSDL